MRGRFQGVGNVVRFNRHFYVFAALAVLILLFISAFLPSLFRYLLLFMSSAAVLTTILSLAVSHYVYDISDIYDLDWIDDAEISSKAKIVNINAGFDETSVLLKRKFPESELVVFDFYDAEKHTEISIERARKAYPPYPKTARISTAQISLPNESADAVFLVFAAHEIRLDNERVAFFKETNRILKPNGTIYVVEHLRDVPNFLAYNIGFLHFYSKRSWLEVFAKANFTLDIERKLTPFVSAFKLKKDGTAS